MPSLPSLPPAPLIVLRCVATVELSALIAQAGWAAAFLGGSRQFRPVHELGGLLTLVLCAAGAVAYVVLRRAAGAVNVGLAVALAALVGVQYLLAQAQATAAHIFLGVLIAMIGTALTSWTYRHSWTPDRTR